MQPNRSEERGATLVEAAIAYSLLFLTLFAVVEFGLAFKDWLSVSQASREGARAGATFGDDPSADILVLREIETTMAPIGLAAGDSVRVYRANNPNVNASETYTYAPGTECGTSGSWTGNPNPLLACCDWTPCPELGRPNYQTPETSPRRSPIDLALRSFSVTNG